MWQPPRQSSATSSKRSTRTAVETWQTLWPSVQTVQTRSTPPTPCRRETGCRYQLTLKDDHSASTWDRSNSAAAGSSVECSSRSRAPTCFEFASETFMSSTGWAIITVNQSINQSIEQLLDRLLAIRLTSWNHTTNYAEIHMTEPVTVRWVDKLIEITINVVAQYNNREYAVNRMWITGAVRDHIPSPRPNCGEKMPYFATEKCTLFYLLIIRMALWLVWAYLSVSQSLLLSVSNYFV